MLSKTNEFIWGGLLIILIPVVGIYLTFRCGFVQVKFFKTAVADPTMLEAPPEEVNEDVF